MSTELSNKPLIEAILEVRWELQQGAQPGIQEDPHYKLLIGRLYDRLAERYPYHEPLPASQIPDGMVGYIVQHRFRSGEGRWPLVQLGPGILTVNETDAYEWQGFYARCLEAVHGLYSVYPHSDPGLRIRNVVLRYIDGVDFAFEQDDILGFLRDKMAVSFTFPGSLFETGQVGPAPLGLDCRFAFRTSEPPGQVQLRFVRGGTESREALAWETIVTSEGPQAPHARDDFAEWLEKAHAITHDWFFKLIDGELRRRFE